MICGADTAQTTFYINYSPYPYAYAAFDVLLHEFGHQVENILGITTSSRLSHKPYENLAELWNSKDIGISLAWSESFATVFGQIVQDYFKYEFVQNGTTMKFFADKCYTSYETHIYSVEDYDGYVGGLHCYGQRNYGEACEASVTAVLYSFYNKYGVFWSAVKTSQLAAFETPSVGQQKRGTFSAYADYIYNTPAYASYLPEFNRLLTREQIASYGLKL